MTLSSVSRSFSGAHHTKEQQPEFQRKGPSDTVPSPPQKTPDIFLISSGKNKKIKPLMQLLKHHNYTYYLLDHPPQSPGLILLDCTTTSPTPRLINFQQTMVIAIIDNTSNLNHSELPHLFDTLHCQSDKLIIANRIKLYLNYYKTLKQPRTVPVQTHMSRSQLLVYKACSILEKNLSESICTQSLCKTLYTNHNTLYKAFKTQLGMGVHQWLMRRRIEEAIRLLVETDLPIQHIAFDIGFSRQSSFSTFFKTEKGVTPSAYRKIARHNHTLTYSRAY